MTRDVNGAGLSETQWRLVWEERLDRPARRRIWRSALWGEALDDADEAAVAIEFARRRRRVARSAAICNELLYFVLLGAMVVLAERPVTGTYWWMLGTVLTLLVANPLVAFLWSRRLRQSEARNRAVVSRAPAREGDT